MAVVNPRQIRDFARATGQLAKTDALDARVIALFAEAVRPIARPVPDEHARALGDLVARRRQLVDMLCAEQNRRRLLRDRGLQRHLEAHIAWLDDALERLEADLTTLIRSTPIWREADDLLRSVPGVGARHVVRAHRRSAGTRPPGSPTHCRPRRIGPGGPR